MQQDQDVKERNDVPFGAIIFAIFLGTFLTLLSLSTINVALPVLMQQFHAGIDSVEWTLTGFILALGIVSPVVGYLGDRFSYKRLYIVSISGFTLFSILCALSWNIEVLIVCRVFQGIFSGFVAPTTMAIVYQVIPKNKQVQALSLWSMGTMLAPAFGPTIAGWLIENFGWPSLFYMNVPVGLIAILVSLKYLPYYQFNSEKKLDWFGFVTVVLSSTSLLIVFSEGHQWGWSSLRILAILIFGCVTLLLFILWELKKVNPLLNLRVFKHMKFTYSLILNSIITISLYSGTFLTPMFLQNIQHFTAMDTGLILLPSSLIMAILMYFAGRLYDRVGPMKLSLFGILFISLGTWKMSHLYLHTPQSYIAFWMIIRNIGIALSIMPVTNAGMSVVPRRLTGHASSVNNWIRQGLGSFSIGIFASILAARTAAHIHTLSKNQGMNQTQIANQAFTLSVNDVYSIATLIVILAIPLTFLLKKEKNPVNVEQDSLSLQS